MTTGTQYSIAEGSFHVTWLLLNAAVVLALSLRLRRGSRAALPVGVAICTYGGGVIGMGMTAVLVLPTYGLDDGFPNLGVWMLRWVAVLLPLSTAVTWCVLRRRERRERREIEAEERLLGGVDEEEEEGERRQEQEEQEALPGYCDHVPLPGTEQLAYAAGFEAGRRSVRVSARNLEVAPSSPPPYREVDDDGAAAGGAKPFGSISGGDE
ncbi:hypothetical protein DBV05_g7004 [Lasiodiplodia theobromae]|uniref:Uncharacterized protein n=1 Tax=Lasiodiplodia theobromae TaxID=45133 RepID=A0A5N5D913_9PEZI|nr:hypothetical protein DBV05_g7004 [Lasiodiplodia theobromae]